MPCSFGTKATLSCLPPLLAPAPPVLVEAPSFFLLQPASARAAARPSATMAVALLVCRIDAPCRGRSRRGAAAWIRIVRVGGEAMSTGAHAVRWLAGHVDLGGDAVRYMQVQ